jgi:hypothetical protein
MVQQQQQHDFGCGRPLDVTTIVVVFLLEELKFIAFTG